MISVNLNKAKEIGHALRRAARDKEFQPLDDAIAKQIPGQIEGAEAQRQVIRDKYAAIQVQIDAATTTDEIKAAVGI